VSAVLDNALGYAAQSWLVLPLHSVQGGVCTCRKRSTCPNAGKHPRTRHGAKDGTTNGKRIWEWWLRWPGANVGVATGAESGLIVLDIDPRNRGDGTFDGLRDRYGELPEGPIARTGGGGRHLLFRYPGERVRGSLGPGVDVQGDGKLIVAPSSFDLAATNCKKRAKRRGKEAS